MKTNNCSDRFNIRYTLPKTVKLIKTDDFSSVFNFRKRLSAEFLIMHFQPNVYSRPRIGLVVAKKVEKSSVRRNYMRRVLRELFRLQQHEIAAADFIVRVQKKFTPHHFAQIKQEFTKLVSQINHRIDRLPETNTQVKVPVKVVSKSH